MRLQFKVMVIAGSLLTASLGAAASATAATTAPPVMDTSVFACNNGVCEVGPGNIGTPFAAGLNVKIPGNYTPAVERYYGDDFTMKVISGSLPPGLQLSLPSTEWIVTGTPSRAGTYPFTVQFTPTQDDPFGQAGTGTQQLSITIGTGSSDRLVATGALYQGHQFRLYVDGFDVNISAQYSVVLTSTGKLLIPAQANTSTWDDGLLALSANINDPCGALNSCNITLKDSLGSSVTITLPPAKY
jgi:hypothetical protein